MDGDYKRAVVEAGKTMLHSGLTVETWGNISVRNREAGQVYITPSGLPYDELLEDDVVTVGLDGRVLKGHRRPSVETPLHVAVYKARMDVDAVLHTHPIYSTVFSCMDEDIPLFIDEAAQTLGDTVRTAKYALPGSPELAQNCVAALGRKANACLLKSHGAVCVGKNLAACFRTATVLEMTARVLQLIRSMGGTFHPLSDENIAATRELVKKTRYGQ
ncbi:MAG: class II aldolase/adducin family protein [Synergistaceae bacterium]|jgi:L-fuculose-phosphate aldolase|nr:class II aldolase/adducin family protein [Synergistaceae bacterium]